MATCGRGVAVEGAGLVDPVRPTARLRSAAATATPPITPTRHGRSRPVALSLRPVALSPRSSRRFIETQSSRSMSSFGSVVGRPNRPDDATATPSPPPRATWPAALRTTTVPSTTVTVVAPPSLASTTNVAWRAVARTPRDVTLYRSPRSAVSATACQLRPGPRRSSICGRPVEGSDGTADALAPESSLVKEPSKCTISAIAPGAATTSSPARSGGSARAVPTVVAGPPPSSSTLTYRHPDGPS